MNMIAYAEYGDFDNISERVFKNKVSALQAKAEKEVEHDMCFYCESYFWTKIPVLKTSDKIVAIPLCGYCFEEHRDNVAGLVMDMCSQAGTA